MCGRFTLSANLPLIQKIFRTVLIDEEFEYNGYNIAPTQNIPVITEEDGRRRLAAMKWGLVPHWAKDLSIGSKMINARAETVDQKPAFKTSFLRRRCLIPADGFYEWKKENGSKTPMRIILPDREIFAFAGLWAAWKSPAGKEIHSCSIITTGANEQLRPIHDRMPVILAEEWEHNAWLGLSEQAALKDLLRPYQGPMHAYEVSRLVNNPGNDGPRLIEPV